MAGAREGDLLWEPSPKFIAASNLARYQAWLQTRTNLRFRDYNDLWQWSVADVGEFWSTIWTFFEMGPPHPRSAVLPIADMPGAVWFEGANLNFTERIFSSMRDGPAILAYSECRESVEMSWSELEDQVGVVASALREIGVEPGDTIAAYLPNVIETVVALLATASIGAVWSCCSPEFGASSVLARFRQIEPKVLFAVDGYRYAGSDVDRSDVVAALRDGLPTLKATVMVPNLVRTNPPAPAVIAWDALLANTSRSEHLRVPFLHPLWVLYTSGTTGPPKAIVHSHGGIVLEYLKNMVLANDRKADDRFLSFSSTGWVLWNMLVGNLLAGATIVLYDGSPVAPDVEVLWQLAARAEATVLGCSPALIELCMAAGRSPSKSSDLSRLRALSITGAPLSPEAGHWIYENTHSDLWLVTGSGGTDIASSFVGASPFMPVRAGQIPARLLGVDVHAFDEEGRAVVDEVGELVVVQPMPSMPISFWGDESGDQYLSTYFDRYPGVWRHGDWVTITSEGAAVIHGRSDATINRRGVRVGTSEIYRIVEAIPEIIESLVVDLVLADGRAYMPLFVVLAPGAELDDELNRKTRTKIVEHLSPRFVPDEMIAVTALPRTLTGKKLEIPVKRILLGERLDKVVAMDSVANPNGFEQFVDLARDGMPPLAADFRGAAHALDVEQATT